MYTRYETAMIDAGCAMPSSLICQLGAKPAYECDKIGNATALATMQATINLHAASERDVLLLCVSPVQTIIVHNTRQH